MYLHKAGEEAVVVAVRHKYQSDGLAELWCPSGQPV